jgi:hypothetical protein
VTLLPQTVDRYGRTVAEVIGEVNLNLAMVEDGQAFAYRQYLGQCNANEYLDAEYRASRHRFGVWQVPGGINRPWDFRRARRSGGSSRAVSSGVAPAGTAPAAIAGQHDRLGLAAITGRKSNCRRPHHRATPVIAGIPW